MVTASSLKVVLISANRKTSPEIRKGAQSLALTTIQRGLKERGFGNVSLFPRESSYPVPEFSQDPKFKAELDAELDRADRAIIGISTTTRDYYLFQEVSSFLRKNYPWAKIVAGGPHFKRETLVDSKLRKYRDPVEVALSEGLADAVVVGHAEPFLDFICNHDGNLKEVSSPGFYSRDARGRIIGKGVGRYPRLSEVPYVFEDEKKTAVQVMISDTCANHCSFCSINLGSLGFSRDVIKKSLREILKKEGLRQIIFVDSNPFEPRPNILLPILKEIESPTPSVYKFGYLDPSLLLDPAANELFAKLYVHGFINFFMGRDAVSKEGARIIGLKYKGRIKDQGRLDAERAAIVKFINMLSRVRGKLRTDKKCEYPPKNFYIDLAYMMHPFTSEQEQGRIYSEMNEFSGLSNDEVSVHPNFTGLLSPFPGTETRKRMVDYIRDPERFDHFRDGCSFWDSEKLTSMGFSTVANYRKASGLC